jgi:AraC family transcriptional regulator
MLRVVDHIRAHLDDELSPETLAAVAGFSLHHFHRVFRGMIGQSVMEFVRDQRLERAAFLLKHGDRPVTEVAFDAGYGSHEAFTRAFKARFDAAPSAFRDAARELRDAQLPITLRREPEAVVLSWHRVGPYDGASEVWSSLLAFASAHTLFWPRARLVGFVFDDPEIVPPERTRYEAAIVVDPADRPRWSALALPTGARWGAIPAGQYAVGLHVGPYEESGRTYVGLLGRALPSRGVDLVDEPVIEVYLNSPADTPPAELRTEIMVRTV